MRVALETNRLTDLFRGDAELAKFSAVANPHTVEARRRADSGQRPLDGG
jgi:hypothetical protein